MRAGTSKGLFIKREYLPVDQTQWIGPLLAAMGGDSRQLNGVGGASSTTSKVAVVGRSARESVDVDYTFAQVSVGGGKVDLSGNCGNMASGVGPFAIQEGLVQRPKSGETNKVDVRIFNTNTERTIVETVEVDDNGHVQENGNYAMPGLRGITGSEMKVAFMDPAGSMTGQLFPTGNPCDYLSIHVTETGNTEPFTVRATLLDVANPFILVDASTLPFEFQDPTRDDALYLSLVESIRRKGAVCMGLADSIAAAAQVRGTPKIAFLWPALDGKADIRVRSFSMGKPHPSLQLTGAVCLGGGVCLPGTVPNRLATLGTHMVEAQQLPTPSRTPSPVSLDDKKINADGTSAEERTVKIEHSSGLMEVEVVTRYCLGNQGDQLSPRVEVERCVISRTARRLFEGNVCFYL
ncbi:PrpF protein-domain-containing protein [Mariannaea sp. PMI_226]|nr:PrpF protein-domain-containing protein [Mariannaea sp. PMI_226]